ncbi:MAG: AI-2E family transporter [Steroidobacteraceae bacterium]
MLHKIKGATVHRLPPAVASSRFSASRGLFVLGIGAVLYVGSEAFIPVVFAGLLSLVLSGPVEGMFRKHVPRGLTAVLIMLALLGAIAGMLNLVTVPAQQWFASAPQTMRVVKQKIRPVAAVMDRIEEIRNSAGNLSSTHRPATPTVTAIPPQNAPVMLLGATRVAVVSLVTVVILTVFLLSGGPPMLARLTSALSADVKAAHALEIIEKLRGEVGRFYLTTALINLGLGSATALSMWALGMPSPVLWGTVAAVLNFIPYAGSATTLLLLTSVAIVSFNSLSHVLAVTGTYLALATLEGQVVQPLLVGRRLALNPVIVFLALWFGGFFWGIPGIALATPLLVTLKVIAENSRDGKPLLEFLSPS